MHRYFTNQKKDNNFIVTSDYHHIVNVLRLQVNDEIEIVYNQKVYLCCIKDIDEYNYLIIASITKQKQIINELAVKINLFQSLLKKDNFELVIQKAVELGVYSITPVIFSRTISRHHFEKNQLKTKRWQLIAKNAAKQAKRNLIPKIKDVISWYDVKFSKNDLNLIAYEKYKNKFLSLKQALKNLSNRKESARINLVIGPEGGLEQKEISFLQKDHKINLVSLGKRILRAETASLVFLSIIVYLTELGGE